MASVVKHAQIYDAFDWHIMARHDASAIDGAGGPISMYFQLFLSPSLNLKIYVRVKT